MFQKDSTRSDVRARDLGCRVTGQKAPPGSRGYNFNELEVAHIFPLAAHASVCQFFFLFRNMFWPFLNIFQFNAAFNHTAHEKDLYAPLKIPRVVTRLSQIDIPANALVMRADVHAQFDGYEFSYETFENPQVLPSLSATANGG
jgi:hypothetical protein